jgi:hypothetical protein
MGAASSCLTKRTQNETSTASSSSLIIDTTRNEELLQGGKDKKSNNNNIGDLITPRCENLLIQSIPYTPCGEEVNLYRYYCPLCMEFFKHILKSKCCGNYICLSCCVTFLSSQDLQVGNVNDILSSHNEFKMKSLDCPHCCQNGFEPQLVVLQDSVRDYSMNSPKFLFDDDNNNNISHSPVKIGDSFESLKRKMKPFSSKSNLTGNIKSNIDSNIYDNITGEEDNDNVVNIEPLARKLILSSEDDLNNNVIEENKESSSNNNNDNNNNDIINNNDINNNDITNNDINNYNKNDNNIITIIDYSNNSDNNNDYNNNDLGNKSFEVILEVDRMKSTQQIITIEAHNYIETLFTELTLKKII